MSTAFAPWPIIHLSMFLLRVVTGFALIYYQGWRQISLGWAYLWDENRRHWDLVAQFAEKQPGPVAVAFAFMTALFFFVSPLLLGLGFLTRLNAFLIFTGLVVTLLHEIQLSSTLHHQTMLIYLMVMVFFVMNGGGAVSVDRLFDRRRGLDITPGGLYSR